MALLPQSKRLWNYFQIHAPIAFPSILVVVALLFSDLACILPLFAQIEQHIERKSPALFDNTSVPQIAGNSFYQIVVERGLGVGVGLYSVRTGSLHPVTLKLQGKQDVLVGGGKQVPATSYTTIRSYSSKTDYVQSELAVQDQTHRIVWLDSLFINDQEIVPDTVYFKPIYSDSDSLTGYCVKYSLPGLKRPSSTAVIRDTMEITQIINVHGTSFDDSWVEITTLLENTGTLPLTAGIRYLWDVAVAGDDGPLMTTLGSKGSSLFETAHTRLDFAYIKLHANDKIKAQPPGYDIFGSALTLAGLRRAPFQPVRLQQVSWPRAFFRSFDYLVTDTLDVTSPNDPHAGQNGGDNAIQYFWGERPETALTFWPGQTIKVTQALFAALRNEEPTALLDWEPPSCDISFLGTSPKSIAVTVQDPNSGLHSIRIQEQENVDVLVPDFEYGINEPVRVLGTAIDETKPFILMLETRDLSGRTMICDPILLTLAPAFGIPKYNLTPIAQDRYLYIKNQGLQEIEIRLNGYLFALKTSIPAPHSRSNFFKLPLHGETTIDMGHYLKSTNTMTITFNGPPESRADLVISEATIKGTVDHTLDPASLPQQFALLQNTPNPFHGSTKIRFEVPMRAPEAQNVQVRVYNTLGQVVRILVDANIQASTYLLEWDGRNDLGRPLSAGVYFYRLDAGEVHLTKKLALLQR